MGLYKLGAPPLHPRGTLRSSMSPSLACPVAYVLRTPHCRPPPLLLGCGGPHILGQSTGLVLPLEGTLSPPLPSPPWLKEAQADQEEGVGQKAGAQVSSGLGWEAPEEEKANGKGRRGRSPGSLPVG